MGDLMNLSIYLDKYISFWHWLWCYQWQSLRWREPFLLWILLKQHCVTVLLDIHFLLTLVIITTFLDMYVHFSQGCASFFLCEVIDRMDVYYVSWLRLCHSIWVSGKCRIYLLDKSYVNPPKLGWQINIICENLFLDFFI